MLTALVSPRYANASVLGMCDRFVMTCAIMLCVCCCSMVEALFPSTSTNAASTRSARAMMTRMPLLNTQQGHRQLV